MATKIQLRGDTLANWLAVDPILSDREQVLVATDPLQPKVYDSKKVGDGTKKFSQLPMLGYECLQSLGNSPMFPISQKAASNLFARRVAWLYDTTTAIALDVDENNWYIPSGLKLYVFGVLMYQTAAEITVPKQVGGTLECLLFNSDTSTFRSATYNVYSTLFNTQEILVAKHVRGQMDINAEYYKIGGTLYRKSIDITNQIKYASRMAHFYDVTELNCPYVDATQFKLRSGSKLMIQGFNPITISADIVIPVLSTGVYNYLLYDTKKQEFKIYNYGTNVPDSMVIIGYGVRDGYVFNSTIYEVDGVIYRNTIRSSDVALNNNDTLKSFVRFFDNVNEIKTASILSCAKALKNINIYSNTNKWSYHIIAVKETESTQDMFIMYSYDKDGNRGQDIRLGTSKLTYLYDRVWYAKVTANNDEIEIIFDHAASGYFVSMTLKDLKISHSRYQKKSDAGYGFDDREFCSLGASTSTGAWLSSAATRLGMNFKGFGVPGTRWGFLYNDEILDYSGEMNNNINMMNEVARLYKYADENPTYYPEVMTFLCGINGLNKMAAENWEDAFVLEIDLSTIDPISWFTEAVPLAWKKSYVISMRACIEFISRRFPKCQLIVMTPQLAAQFGWTNNKAMRDNLVGVAMRCSIPIIDFFYESGFNDITHTDSVFSDDNLHPNTDGNILFTNFFEQQLRQKIAFRK